MPAADGDPTLDPDRIRVTGFSTSFRGYDTHEVRRYLERLAETLRSQSRAGDGDRLGRQRAEQQVAELRSTLAERDATLGELRLELAAVRAELAEASVFDEDRAAELLGRETTQVLEAARRAAAELTRKAQADAERTLAEAAELRAEAEEERSGAAARAEAEVDDRRREVDEELATLRAGAQAEADRLVAEAAEVLERRTAEGEAAAAAVRAEAERVRRDAEADAEATLEAAREQGRQLIAEARSLREQVLADLVKRRRASRQQLDQLKAGRDRLARALGEVRRQLDESVGELAVAVPEARHAAETASRRARWVDERSEVADLAGELDAARTMNLWSPLSRSSSAIAPTGDEPGDDDAGGPAAPSTPVESTPAVDAEPAEDAPTPGPDPAHAPAPAEVPPAADQSAELPAPEPPGAASSRGDRAGGVPAVAPVESPASGPLGAASSRGDRAGGVPAVAPVESPASGPLGPASPRGDRAGGVPAVAPVESPASGPLGPASPRGIRAGGVPAVAPVGSPASGPVGAASPPEVSEGSEADPEGAGGAGDALPAAPPGDGADIGAERAEVPAAGEDGPADSSAPPDAEAPPDREPAGGDAVEVAEVTALAPAEGELDVSAAKAEGGRDAAQRPAGPPGTARKGASADLDSVFARIRASRSQAVHEARQVLAQEPTATAAADDVPADAPTSSGGPADAPPPTDDVPEPPGAPPTPLDEAAADEPASVGPADAPTPDDDTPADAPAPPIGPAVDPTPPDVAAVGADAGPSQEEASVAGNDRRPFEARDEALVPLERQALRALKRALADGQSELLDLVGRGKGPVSADDLPSVEDQRERYQRAGRSAVDGALRAGAAAGGGTVDEAAVAGLVEALAHRVADPITARVRQSIDTAGGERDLVLERIRAHYREFRTGELTGLVADALAEAYAVGLYRSFPAGTPLVWTADPRTTVGPDCYDNSLAGPVPVPEPYPTGHQSPPGAPACRCLTLPSGD